MTVWLCFECAAGYFDVGYQVLSDSVFVGAILVNPHCYQCGAHFKRDTKVYLIEGDRPLRVAK